MLAIGSLGKRILVFHSRKQLLVFLLFLLLVGFAGVHLWGFYAFSQAELEARNFQLEQGQKHIGACLWIWPRSEKVKVLAARIARLGGRYEEAKVLLRDCRVLSGHTSGPVQLELFLNRAQRGELETVAPFLWRCVEEDHPDSDQILETLVRVYLGYERFPNALSCLEKWLQIDPDNLWAHELRGVTREMINQKEHAIEDYTFVLQRQPDRFSARGRLGLLLVDLHQVEGALPHAEYLTKNDPGRAEGWVLLARCQYEQGQYGRARKSIEKVLQQHPDNLDGLLWGGIISFHQEQYAEAAKLLQQVVQRVPSNTLALGNYYHVLKSQHDPQAPDLFKRLKKLRNAQSRLAEIKFKELSVGFLTLPELVEGGKLFLETDQKAEGIHWLNLALKMDPNHTEIHRFLVDYYKGIKDYEKAEQHQRLIGAVASDNK